MVVPQLKTYVIYVAMWCRFFLHHIEHSTQREYKIDCIIPGNVQRYAQLLTLNLQLKTP